MPIIGLDSHYLGLPIKDLDFPNKLNRKEAILWHLKAEDRP